MTRGAESLIVGLDHVQLALPPGGEDLARHFYGRLLGLVEVPKPDALARRGGCWFVGRGVHLHLGVDSGFAPARKAHVAFVVADLARARAALDAAGVRTVDDDAAIEVARCYVDDPFGNRLELVAEPDAGFTSRQTSP